MQQHMQQQVRFFWFRVSDIRVILTNSIDIVDFRFNLSFCG